MSIVQSSGGGSEGEARWARENRRRIVAVVVLLASYLPLSAAVIALKREVLTLVFVVVYGAAWLAAIVRSLLHRARRPRRQA